MRVLYVARLFSGLERSVAERGWFPTGVPTIYKMIEELSRNTELHLVMLAKGGHSSLNGLKSGQIRLEGLNAEVSIVTAKPDWLGPLTWVANGLREARHAFLIAWALRSVKPDLIYIDHGNIWTAGLLARLCQTPIVLRIMGVYPAMREALVGRRLAHRYLKWCYHGPYSAVVCTQDGSGVEPWLRQAIRPSVPTHTLVNGADQLKGDVELHADIARIPQSAVVVMFLGKLEHGKGALEFARGFAAAKNRNLNLHALIVGAGSLKDGVLGILAEAGVHESVTLIERLPHDQVLSALARADIYVSLNRFGNLSNANLEAMRVGVAMIFPSSQPGTGVDVATDALLSSQAVRRIASADDIEGLSNALGELAAAPDRRKAMGAAVQQIASNQIGDWDDRIRGELQILQSIVGVRSDSNTTQSPTLDINDHGL